jgi:citrate synthase
MFKRAARLAVPRTTLQTRAASTKVRLLAARAMGCALTAAQSLKDTLKEVIPAKQEQLKRLVRLAPSAVARCSCARSPQKSEHGQAVLGETKVEHVIGGMRGLKSMLWDASVLDPHEGIRFHGHTIPDCQRALPAAPGAKEMLPESMLWLLLTGQVPSEAQVRALSAELAEQGELPKYVEELMDA